MPAPRSGRLRLAAESERTQLVPSAVMGMLIFVFTEMMLFAGLLSAFSIVRAGAVVWPPPGQPRLPIQATAFNTGVLLASAVALFLAQRRFFRDRSAARRPLLAAMLLGAFFVVFQGVEWVRLVAQGLTLTSSTLGSFFYLIVGLHALHAIAALCVLVYTWRRLERGWLAQDQLAAAQVFWYFVVGLWPVLYGVVYL
jgi:cytochrome c oxidase subunit III